MSKVQFNPKHKVVLDSFMLDNLAVSPGKMFGHPAYYVRGKVFASLYMDGVVLKLPESRVEELLGEKGFVPFTSMGRKMREWIMIVHEDSSDYLADKEVFEESFEYVLSLVSSRLKKK